MRQDYKMLCGSSCKGVFNRAKKSVGTVEELLSVKFDLIGILNPTAENLRESYFEINK